jgi:hypothetical protein
VVGSEVKLHGLKTADLNGALGACEAWNADTGRWRLLLQSGVSVNVKPEPLQADDKRGRGGDNEPGWGG